MTSDSKRQEGDLRDEPGPLAGAEAAPWEKRYENLWVEVEKRHVKSNYKNVACELKEKFGELLQSAPSAEEEEQEWDEPGEDSSDEEEGEVIVRPTARARSSILLTIPEQRESGLEDSDRSTCEDRRQVQEQQTSSCPGPDWSTHQESTKTTIASTNHQSHNNKVLPHETTVSQQGVLWKQNAASPRLAEKNLRDPEDPGDPEGSTKSEAPSLMSCAAPAQEASLEGLEEEEEERFKLGVATPEVVLQHLEKENCGHQREVEEAVALIVA